MALSLLLCPLRCRLQLFNTHGPVSVAVSLAVQATAVQHPWPCLCCVPCGAGYSCPTPMALSLLLLCPLLGRLQLTPMALSLLLCPLRCRLQLSNTHSPISVVVSLAVQATAVQHPWPCLCCCVPCGAGYSCLTPIALSLLLCPLRCRLQLSNTHGPFSVVVSLAVQATAVQHPWPFLCCCVPCGAGYSCPTPMALSLLLCPLRCRLQLSNTHGPVSVVVSLAV